MRRQRKYQRKAPPRLRPSGLPSVGREPNGKAVCLSPLSRRWATGVFKPQTNERGIVFEFLFDLQFGFKFYVDVFACRALLIRLGWKYIYFILPSLSCTRSLVSSRARNKRQGGVGGLCFVKARRLADCPQRGHPTKSDADTKGAFLCVLSLAKQRKYVPRGISACYGKKSMTHQ